MPVTDEGWTAKDVLAHLIHWATQIGFGLGMPVERPVYVLEERKCREAAGIDTAQVPKGEESNALAVAYYRAWALADVRALFDRLADGITDQARARTDEQMLATDVIPYASRKRPLWQKIGSETFLHWPQHAEAMERAARS